jgi:hypothetical protein
MLPNGSNDQRRTDCTQDVKHKPRIPPLPLSPDAWVQVDEQAGDRGILPVRKSAVFFAVVLEREAQCRHPSARNPSKKASGSMSPAKNPRMSMITAATKASS